MTSTKPSRNAARLPLRRLRSALALRYPAGSCIVDGCRIVWHQLPSEPVEARGLPVICLHTVGSGSREFRPLIERFPAGTRLVLLDWPGHGRSQDDARHTFSLDRASTVLAAVLSQLGIRRAILMGCGFGAATALRYAADHPGQVSGLVLCQPAGLIVPRRANRLAAGEAHGPALRQALREQLLQPAFVPAALQAEESLIAAQPNLRSALESLACPTLFALSRQNRKYPLQRYLDWLDPALARSPQHRITVFSGSFHPIWDEPDRFAQALASFIQAQLPFAEHRHAWLLTEVDWPTRTMNLWKCVHPECDAEQVLPEGQDANRPAQSAVVPAAP